MTQMKVSVAYGLTKPGEVPYSSENFRVGFEIEDEMTSEQAESLAATLSTTAKLSVITQAGLSAGTDENGVTSPVFIERSVAPVVPISSAPSAPSPYATDPADQVPFDATPDQSAAIGQPAPQQANGQQVWDGRPVKIYDNRRKKVAPGVVPNKEQGEFASNAADFNIKFLDVGDQAPNNVKYQSIWLMNRDGTISAKGQAVKAMVDGS